MSKKVIELIRVSTESQAGEDRASIPAQRTANRRTEQAFGLQIVKSIELSDVSGAAVLMAPEIQELLRIIASPDIHGVVTKEFSRLMRPENFSDYAILQVFVETKTVLYLPDGPIDFSNKTGMLLGGIRALMAGAEISDIRERSWDAKEAKRKAGGFPQSYICLGFGVGYNKERGWHYTPEVEKMREAFQLVLSGTTSYASIAKKVGLSPFHLRVALRNHIYTGWRVIDERRDPSPSARRTKPDGRQADRPKIKRPPEEVIRVKVIDKPIISEEDFLRVQQILDLKRERHWRVQPDHEFRFTYNGFITCSVCDTLVYTKLQREDYYVCKKRILEKNCPTRYMRRDRLERELDQLFTERLTDAGFLREIVEEMENSAKKDGVRQRIARLKGEINRLQAKRQRVLDSYFDDVINQAERDTRLAKIERDLSSTREMLEREKPPSPLTVDLLTAAFSPFFEYGFLGREDKRRLLSTIMPEIRVADYRVEGISFLPPFFSSESIRKDTGSLSRRA